MTSALEDRLAFQLTAVAIPTPIREHRFHPTRRWRFDFAWPGERLAVEVDGAIWTGGRHTRGAGYLKDLEKLNTAAVLGWRVLRVAEEHIKSGQALTWIESFFPRENDNARA